MKSIWCILGYHDWAYSGGVDQGWERECQKCKKKQKETYDMTYGETIWEDLNLAIKCGVCEKLEEYKKLWEYNITNLGDNTKWKVYVCKKCLKDVKKALKLDKKKKEKKK